MYVLCPVCLRIVGETSLGWGGVINLGTDFVGYIRIFILLPLSFCLWSPVNWLGITLYIHKSLAIDPITSVQQTPILRLLMMNHMHILVATLTWMLWTATASLIDQNVPSWLNFLLEWEPQTPICWSGHFFFVTLRSRFTGFRLLP
jgi:hypothetical protein